MVALPGDAGSAAGQQRPPMLEMRDVVFRYDGMKHNDPPILNGLNLVVAPGDQIGIVGPNGGGKTTLVKLVIGMHAPQQGDVKLFGDRVSWGRHYPHLGYIGNPSRNDGESGLPLDVKVGNLLDWQRELFEQSGLPCPFFDKLASGLELDRTEWRGKKVRQLSDGWRQRVLFHLALAKQPKLLVADEATVGLDIEHREPLLKVVRAIAEDTNMAVLWVTHSPRELFTLGLRVLEVAQGTVAPVTMEAWSGKVTLNDGDVRIYDGLPTGVLLDLISELASDRNITKISVELSRFGGRSQKEQK